MGEYILSPPLLSPWLCPIIFDMGYLPRADGPARTAMVKQYQRQHPDATYAEVGAIFGISDRRAWQILNDYPKPRGRPCGRPRKNGEKPQE